MAYCNECPDCGANLDPGEHCNCKDDVTETQASIPKIVYKPQEKQNVG